MNLIRHWLMTILLVSLVVSLAKALMPKDSKAGELVCGLALLCGILWPVAHPVQFRRGDFDLHIEQNQQELQQELDKGMRAVIEEQCGAYIQTRAKELGLNVTAEVRCREADGIFLPERAEVTGKLSAEQRRTLSGILSADLGIPAEQQTWSTEEAEP